MPEHFLNEGFGWECKRCCASGEAESASHPGGEEPGPGATALARFFREGEAEGGGPRLSSAALARWKDGARRVLRCERCGAEESVSDAPGENFT